MYRGSLYITLNINISLHAPIFFSTKYYIILVIISSLLTYIIFWDKNESNMAKLIKNRLANKIDKIARLNKIFRNISSTSYFIKNVWTRSTNVSWAVKNIIITTDINSLNKLIGYTIQLLIKKATNRIVANHNNYLLTIFMTIILITIII